MPLLKLACTISWVSLFLASNQGLIGFNNFYFQGESIQEIFKSGNSQEKLNDSVKKLPSIYLSSNFDNAESTLVSSSQALVLNKTSNWQKLSENPFCRLISKQQEGSSQLDTAKSQSHISLENQVVRLGISQKVIVVFQKLLRWSEIITPQSQLTSTSVKVATIKTAKSYHRQRKIVVQGRNFKQNLVSYNPARTNRTSTQPLFIEQEEFQVWVRGKLVAKIPNKERANLIVQRLNRWLSEPDFNALRVQPTVEEGKPAGKIGDRLLFVVDHNMLPAGVLNSEILAIEWINNLRVALDVPPLNLTEAQIQMHGLVETSSTFGGLASWYGPYFHGRLTANGEIYDQNGLTAAHPSMKLNTYLKVTNLNNQKTLILRLNDRGPYIPPRSLDLSLGAARCIDSIDKGVIPYKAVIMEQHSTSPEKEI